MGRGVSRKSPKCQDRSAAARHAGAAAGLSREVVGGSAPFRLALLQMLVHCVVIVHDMTHDEYERRKGRLEEQLRAGIELLETAHRAQITTYRKTGVDSWLAQE
jgi:hypothetical protein